MRPKKVAHEEGFTNVCLLCERRYVYTRSKGEARLYCPSCIVNRHRFALKAAGVAYLGGKCLLCGYARSLQCLDFHHLDPKKKRWTFGGKHNLGWWAHKSELRHCVCLCRNCHGEVEEAITWFPEAPILKRVASLSAQLVRDETVSYSARDWKKYHPKYRIRSIEHK